MIVIPINVTHVSGGTGPWTFTFASTNPNVTFDNPTGTVPFVGGAYIASTNVLYSNQSDIGVGTVSCTFVDTTSGCSKTLTPLIIDNPCNIQSTISNNGEFVFVATTTGGSGSYTYDWVYDTQIFEPNMDTNLNDNVLSLKIKKLTNQPVSTLIQVLITDGNGCTLSKSYSYTFCYPTTNTPNIPLVCNTTNPTGCSLSNVKSSLSNFDLKPFVVTCSNQTIDWTKTTFNIPVEYCVYHVGNGILNIASSKNIGFSAIIGYTVITTSGLQASGQMVINTPICASKTSLYGRNTTIQLIAGDVVGTDKLIEVESRVAGTPNWATFTFTNTPSWGTVTLNANRQIVYDITNITTTPNVPDIIKWSLQDYSGNQINITDTVLRDILPVQPLLPK